MPVARGRMHDADRAAAIGEDDRRARRAELLGRDEVVAGEVLALLLADVERARRREVLRRGAPSSSHRIITSTAATWRPRPRRRFTSGPLFTSVYVYDALGRVVADHVVDGRRCAKGFGLAKAIPPPPPRPPANGLAAARERIRRRGGGARTGWTPARRAANGLRRRAARAAAASPRHGCGRERGRDGSALSRTIMRPADLDLIARLDLALVDARAVHHRARLVAEIDERDVLGRRDLDDRVHARRELVVDAQVALRVLADLDDVLRHRLATDELHRPGRART